MTKLKGAEFGARIFVWMGAWLLETTSVWERTSKNITPLILAVFLWALVIATYVTGILDLTRFPKRNKEL